MKSFVKPTCLLVIGPVHGERISAQNGRSDKRAATAFCILLTVSLFVCLFFFQYFFYFIPVWYKCVVSCYTLALQNNQEIRVGAVFTYTSSNIANMHVGYFVQHILILITQSNIYTTFTHTHIHLIMTMKINRNDLRFQLLRKMLDCLYGDKSFAGTGW